MARHSHWANIQHKKAAADKVRGKAWSLLARHMIAAARTKGGDPETNPTLRDLMLKARAANMPKDGIERAIKKGTGDLEGAVPEQIIYEAYGPGGVAILLEILTDNRTRTASEVREILARHGGNLAGSGAVAWNFEMKGTITIPAKALDPEALLDLAVGAGADDVETEGDHATIVTPPERFEAVRAALAAKKITPEHAALGRIPKTTVSVGIAEGRTLLELIGKLEEHDDVETVVANHEVPEELLAEAAR